MAEQSEETNNIEKSLQNKWRALATERLQLEVDTFKEYKGLTEKAKNNNLLAPDIEEIDARYNQRISEIHKKDQQIIEEAANTLPEIGKKFKELEAAIQKLDPSWKDDPAKTFSQRMESANNITRKIENKLSSKDGKGDGFDSIKESLMLIEIELIKMDIIQKVKENQEVFYSEPTKQLVEAFGDYIKKKEIQQKDYKNPVNHWEQAFRNIYVSGTPDKNLSLPEKSTTTDELLSTLLKNNPGIAVSDLHSKATGKKFLIENMERFKKSGVDTIYIEEGSNTFLPTQKLSIEELKQKINDITPEISEKHAKENAKIYGKEKGYDSYSYKLKLLLTAKEHGIEIVNIDKDGDVRDHESRRIESTNFTWTENIIKDRNTNKKSGKYIVFGGGHHFKESTTTNGLVDEALELPLIDFDNRDIDTKTPILRSKNSSGADFYLPGGECHPDEKISAEIIDNYHLKNIPEPIKNILPESAILFIKYSALNDMESHMANEPCIDVSEATNKKPLSTPPAPPAQQKQSPGQAH